MGDEVREISRSQIMENVLGHSKKCGFYSVCNGKEASEKLSVRGHDLI